jgi:succinate dehydrogenase/fumarate reductase-like Fe-S protein
MSDIQELIASCDHEIKNLKRTKRMLESRKRIMQAEKRARVRKIVQSNYKVHLAECIDKCIQCGLIDKDLNLL